MRLVTIDDVPGGSAGTLLPSGEVVHLARAAEPGTIEAWMPGSVAGILAGGPAGLVAADGIAIRAAGLDGAQRERWLERGALLPAATRLLPPIPRPQLIVAAGLAYKSHLAEMAGTPTPANPTAFVKSPTSLSGPGATVALPPQARERVDYEGELAVVFGKHCHRVTESEALSYVAGYTIANDLSARDWVEDVWRATTPWEARQTWEVNIMGKQLPGFTALGPAILTRDEVDAPGLLHLRTMLNNSVVQDASISDLIFPIERMIAWFSQWYSFTPGDVMLTGTPAGVGVGRKPPLFISTGDRVSVSIDRIGTLSTHFADRLA